MKRILFYISFAFLVASCTSNTMYEKPKNLIPKDSMVSLLTDMYIATSAKNIKNKFLKREKNYVVLIYEQYKIDSTRFDISNTYYTSKIEEYSEMLDKVKSNIDSLKNIYKEELRIEDSLRSPKKSKLLKEQRLKIEEATKSLEEGKLDLKEE